MFRSLTGLVGQLVAAGRNKQGKPWRDALIVVLKAHTWIGVHPDPESEAFEMLVAGTAHVAFGHAKRAGRPLPQAPYEIEILIVLERPAYRKDDPEERVYIGAKQVKPDTNNVLAAILDGLQRGPMGEKREKGGPPPGVIVDDSLVQRIAGADKVFGAVGEKGSVEVVLRSRGPA